MLQIHICYSVNLQGFTSIITGTRKQDLCYMLSHCRCVSSMNSAEQNCSKIRTSVFPSVFYMIYWVTINLHLTCVLCKLIRVLLFGWCLRKQEPRQRKNRSLILILSFSTSWKGSHILCVWLCQTTLSDFVSERLLPLYISQLTRYWELVPQSEGFIIIYYPICIISSENRVNIIICF